jgi:anaerobic carbon-monoxide dehydrogenase iron sulfur subunit
MEKKILSHDPNLCTGCMYCMIACSTYKEGATSLSRARLQIIRHEGHALTRITEEDELIFTFTGCQQCEDPACAAVCPTNALKRDLSTGAMLHLQNKCIGCRMCLSSCPFGALSFHKDRKQIFKCDLCNGDPTCVKFCPVEALKFVPAQQVPLAKRAETAKKIREAAVEKGKAAGDQGGTQ